MDIIFGIISFSISLFAFIYGATKLFKKRKPLYLQLIVCASGCFALEQLSNTVNLICNGATSIFHIGMIGIFGCNFFLLSANYGTLDRIVDDKTGNRKARKIAFVAPLVLLFLFVAVAFVWVKKDVFCTVMWILILIPALFASYYNLKHIMLPVDDFRLLKATKNCNISALCFYVITTLYVISSGAQILTLVYATSVLTSLAVLALNLSAVKGGKQWGI